MEGKRKIQKRDREGKGKGGRNLIKTEFLLLLGTKGNIPLVNL